MAKELFGQFLIRQGKVRQQHIDEALILQGFLQDSLGAVALAEEMITFQDVNCILDEMDKQGDGFIETALGLGLLSQKQVDKLKIKYPEPRIYLGQLLLATGNITRRDLVEELELFETERELVSSPNVTRAELIGRIASRTGIARGTVKHVFSGVIDTLTRALAAGESVELRDFGNFKTMQYSARKARNPRTGKSISIPRRRVPRLLYAKKLRHRVETGTP
ncbi:MAG: HU family DNA-binding protein [Gemmatimonadota bacterium]|nr:HU family DNA-binding protein [Gemmatimonadota bacterium]